MVKGWRHWERQPWHYGRGWWRVLVSSSQEIPPPVLETVHNASSLQIYRMSFTDWCKFFTAVDVCRLINTSVISIHKTWHEVVHFGSWTKNAEPLLNRSGGCANHRQTFLQNPQVHALFPHFQMCSTISTDQVHTYCLLTSVTVFVRHYKGSRWSADLVATERPEDPQKSWPRREYIHRFRCDQGNTRWVNSQIDDFLIKCLL